MLTDPTGAVHYTHATYIPHEVDGEVIGFFVLVVDQTDKVLTAQALHESEHRYQILAENSSDVVWRLSADGKVEWVSPHVKEVLGYDPSKIVGMSLPDYLHPDDRDQLSDQLHVALAEGAAVTIEARFRTDEHIYRWVSLQARAWQDSSNSPREVIVGMRDVQQLVEDRRLLEQRERLLDLTIEQAPHGTAVLTLNFDFVRVNDALCALLERERGWLYARTFRDLLTETEIGKLERNSEALLSGGSGATNYEMRVQLPSGGDVWLRHSMSVLVDDSGEPTFFVSNVEDVTLDRRMRRNLEFRAQHETLTGLLNRDSLHHELRRVGSQGTGKYAVLYCDLDNFKGVNDEYGHHTGDDVLVATSERIRSAVRRSDVVARLGGDEFVVVLTDVQSMDDCVNVAGKIHRAVSRPIHCDPGDITIGITVGVCLADGHVDPDHALTASDTELLEAKKSSRGTTRTVDLCRQADAAGADGNR